MNNTFRYIYTILLLLVAMRFDLSAQNYKQLIDTITVKKVFVSFDDFVESVDSLREKKEDLSVFIIYSTHLRDKDIEESKISPKYYLNGEFLEDLEALQNKKRTSYKGEYGQYFVIADIMVYDNSADIVYQYYSANKLDRYFYEDEPLYHYIAKLYKNGQIDCAFFYPTVINNPSVWQEHYSQLMYLVFAIKNGEYYVIRDGKGEINAPAMYSLEDYINCCWNEMIGIDDDD